ncbi:class I SAM-dependent methyltransferase [Parvicella tangerina]|uniref:Class I SAM-dependent methyltransferase n=1 Tax=Parvicella tangerina TaxID=2829795 RepID=A0A916N850_9FLAO|nr:class I SAM-dependent methyltransferase [Parvicella tangerina]CAG5076344.1 hypothetical protein CRYO30217_00076 [Parvicella tangerina]
MTDVKVNIGNDLIDINLLPNEDGVLIPYSQKDFDGIKKHFQGFINYRKTTNQCITDADRIRNLPYSVQDRTWRNKTDTLTLIKKEIEEKKVLDVLIVGSGNGWLANQLAQIGHSVLGTDILFYEFDGLKTIKHYDSTFRHILLHPHDINKLSGNFDLIIFENNLPYIKGVYKVVEESKGLLKKRGKIMCTGINVSQNVQKEKERIKSLEEYFQSEWNHSINTYSTKMYFDREDFKSLKKLGFNLKVRRESRNIFNQLLSRKVVTYDGIYTQV